ncbi:MAG: hypothetical protein Fur005_10310 [Roseiflexaceae bacterium]
MSKHKELFTNESLVECGINTKVGSVAYASRPHLEQQSESSVILEHDHIIAMDDFGAIIIAEPFVDLR